MKTLRIYLLIFSCIVLFSCGEEASEQFEKEKFVRIYDFSGFTESFTPIDVKQTEDNGYLIVANFEKQDDVLTRGVYLLKVDESGMVVHDRFLENQYIRALKGLEFINGKYYFMCMNDSYRAVLVETDADVQSPVFHETALSYPGAAAYAGQEGFLVLSYNQVDKATVVSRVSATGAVSVSRNFKIADDDSMEDIVMKHFLGMGKQFPFSVGKFSNGNYFFNGFYDYTFSLVTTGLADDNDVNGFIHGQHENGGFSAVVPLTGNTFAASYFNFGSNYFVPRATLPGGPATISDIGGYHMRELVPDANVHIDRVTIDSKNLLLYSTDVKSRQIALYFYDESSGELTGTMYLGFSNPYTLGRVVTTEDGGLAICGTTFIAGRFPRICLFKISKEELTQLVQ